VSWYDVNSCPLWLTDCNKSTLSVYPVSEPRCQAETSRIQSWSDSYPVARWGAKFLKMRLISSTSDFIWHLRRLKFKDSEFVTYEMASKIQIPLSNMFRSQHSSERKRKYNIYVPEKNIKIFYIILMYVPCMLCSLLSRPTNAQYIFIENILYTVSTPWRCCGYIETCRSIAIYKI